MGRKREKQVQLTHKWALVICVIAFCVGAFEIFTAIHYIQAKKREETVQRIYQIEENDAKKYNVGIQTETKTFGDTTVTIYYPTDAQGQRIPTVQMKLDELVATQQSDPQVQTSSLTFFKAISKPSNFTGLEEVALYQSSYTIEGNDTFKQTAFAKHQHFYLKLTGELVANSDLFKDVDAAKQVLLEQINLAMASNGASEQQKNELYQQMDQLPFNQWEFEYHSGHLVVLLPDNSLHLADVSVLMSHLYASIKSDFLTQEDLAIYEQYIAQQNIVAAASISDATPPQKQQREHGEKLVALTFDDGPDAVLTPRVLDILAQYHAKATFFMLGSKVEGQEAIIQRMVAEGHELGNHTWGHPELTKISAENVVTEYTSTQEAITKASNGVVPKVLRPPYGAYNNMVDELIDIPLVLWSIDTLDWKNRDTASILSEVRQQTFDGGIILMHDIHPTSVDALTSVLQYLQSEGYRMVTVSELHAHYEISPDIYIQ